MTQKGTITEGEIRRLARGFQALRSILRIRILAALAEGQSNVKDLEAKLRVSQPLLSWHLNQLRQAGFVNAERMGREVLYCLHPNAFQDMVGDLEHVLGFSLSSSAGSKTTDPLREE